MHEVNYVPDPSSDVPPAVVCSYAMVTTGTGAPTCFAGFNQVYINLSTGDIYSSSTGSWVLVSSGGGGAVEVFALETGSTPIVESIVPDSGAGIAYNFEGQVWIYSVDASWQQVGSTPFIGDYSGVAPAFTPDVSSTLAVDSVTGTVWYWYGSAWH